jgi:epoxyqueuosine reductase
MNKSQLKHSIKELASKHGFLDCGFAKAGKLDSHADAFDKWLEQGFQADMQYMENHREKRIDPTKLVEGSKTVISLLFNYYPDKEIPRKDNLRISKYAYGIDYHFVVKDRLKKLLSDIEEIAGPTRSRVFIDTAPVLDRAWAEKSGLGWIGKNMFLSGKLSRIWRSKKTPPLTTSAVDAHGASRHAPPMRLSKME